MLLIGACILRPTESTILGAVFGALPSIDNLTCSIGGCRFAYGQNIEDVYAKADQLLYEAKKKRPELLCIGKIVRKKPFRSWLIVLREGFLLW